MPSVVVTGANRGIGLALAKRYSAAGWQVHASARDPQSAETLQAMPSVRVHPLDVSDQSSIDAFAGALAGVPVDHLINNAGVLGPRHIAFGETDLALWTSVLTVNTAGPWLVTERLAANLELGKARRVAVISSQLGSIANAGSGWPPVYAASKAGANMVVRQLALALRDKWAAKETIVLSLHPGWVRTAMGGEEAPESPEESAAGIFTLMNQANAGMSGKFFTFEGEPLPW
ncbi:MAG: SDR family NAD(P)-dependent oxidoreductase [Rhodospirillales bacterium]|nr:SDR family NAD(P)-dependent oxidoreductase [Rhodospirillales bacterium]